MGRPKATVEVDGVTMAGRVVAALRGAGAVRVLLVGGDLAWSVDLGAEAVPDGWPGEGPLAGTATALSTVAGSRSEALVAVAACDQPWLEPSTFGALVGALAADRSAQVAVARTPDGRRHPFPSLWRPGSADLVANLVQAGERRADAAFTRLTVVEVPVDPGAIADVDRPDDLP